MSIAGTVNIVPFARNWWNWRWAWWDWTWAVIAVTSVTSDQLKHTENIRIPLLSRTVKVQVLVQQLKALNYTVAQWLEIIDLSLC